MGRTTITEQQIEQVLSLRKEVHSFKKNIGIEKDPKYYRIAEARIKEVSRQLTLDFNTE